MLPLRSRAVLGRLLLLSLLSGCRAPAIPADPSTQEYAVWHAVLLLEAESTHAQAVVIAPETLPLDEAQLEFQRCLPQHMRDVFDDTPAATLSANVAEDWLRLSNGQSAVVGGGLPSVAGRTTQLLRISRVAFSRFQRDGYVWVDRRSCTARGGNLRCDNGEGKLLHVTHAGDRWTVGETECSAIGFDESGRGTSGGP